jgi:uncharacterized protein YbjT (DUF2867 family)
MAPHTVLVTGATGRQGGAVARCLLASGFAVRALVRDPRSTASLALSQNGATLVIGDFRQPDSLARAMSGVHGVFSVQPLLTGKTRLEVEWGIRVADAAAAAGVSHFVYSSVIGADAAPDVPHFFSKFTIENHIRSIGLPHTILRPAGFMENLLMPVVRNGILRGKLSAPTATDTPQAMIAVDDIGASAATVFATPQAHLGRTLSLVGDVASVREQAEVLGHVMGRTIKPGRLPGLVVRLALGRDLHRMFRWVDTVGQTIPYSLDELRGLQPHPLTFEQWSRRHFGAR